MSGYVVKLLIALWFTSYYNLTQAKRIQRLEYNSWNLTDADGVYNLRTRIPGGIYSDLKQHKVIGDVFYRFNDSETRWISKKDWTYSTKFTVDEELSYLPNINLVFDGVDTFSEIYLNNHKIGSTDNMFVRYVINVDSFLKVGENYLEVRFKSAVNKAKELFNIQAKRYPVVPLCVPDEYNGECHANHVRKMQASFSWDWGPAVPSMGIWKNVYLVGYTVTVFRDVTVKISSNDTTKEWSVEFNVYFEENYKGAPITGDVYMSLSNDDHKNPKQCVLRDYTVTRNQHGELVGTFPCTIPKDKVQLWWPNGYGEANLYMSTISFSSKNIGKRDDDFRSFKLGYRTVELVQDEISSGRKFYFKVNDVPIFAKGTNSIPISILPEHGQSKLDARFLLQSAKDVHMNMIRVWGGGVYESDDFYEIADELGIMIWQDFMFACAMYPTNEDFLNTVKAEVRQQVRRLQYHPSIVLWAGNNENEAALRQNWYGTGHNIDLYHRDYKILYIETIREELRISDSTRPYLTSSPTNGIQSEAEDYLARDPQSHFYGDVHFYNYDNGSWDSSIYPLTRFASEYGYQSLPSYWTLLTATDTESDLQMNSSFLNSRQHLPGGYEKLVRLIQYQLNLPDQKSEDYLKTLIYYSQIVQAMAVKKQTEFYRQWRSSLNSDGKGFTMGALYWQLNDVWVAPTWSGIDIEKKWKMQHYYAKNFFAPVIVTSNLRSDGFLDIYLVSDLKDEIPNVSLNIFVYKWESINPVHNETFKINVPPYRSALVRSFSVKNYFAKIENDPCGINSIKDCFFYFNLTSSKNELIAPDNFVIPLPINQTSAQNHPPKIQVTNVTAVKERKEFEIEITTDKAALFVWLDTKPYIRCRFSENGFLQVTEKKTIGVTTELNAWPKELWDALEVSVLYNATDIKKNNSNQKVYCSVWLVTSILLTKLLM